MSFLLAHFCLIIYHGNILLYFGLARFKINKTKKIFFINLQKIYNTKQSTHAIILNFLQKS